MVDQCVTTRLPHHPNIRESIRGGTVRYDALEPVLSRRVTLGNELSPTVKASVFFHGVDALV
ncbi:hypothetical protein DPMN_063981 [Dreissena polymorpha]|uniref:Uncharacterized protein n=1 Tax=Dreissena polymorpha TaxID=45954 RepID=A0A9D4CCI1_DREPO|nr:hypothetical protein DPMN_063981 [Dreissena polymorpha]